jgi:hypothetical protein
MVKKEQRRRRIHLDRLRAAGRVELGVEIFSLVGFTGVRGFPDAPEFSQQFPRLSMFSVSRFYTIFDHPFVMGFVLIIIGTDSGVGGTDDGIFEDTVSSGSHFEFSRFGVTEFVGPAGGAFQADAAVFPELSFGFESKGGIEECQESYGSDDADAGYLLPLFDDGFSSCESLQLFSGHDYLNGMCVETDPEHVQLICQGGEFLFFEPGLAFLVVAYDRGGDRQAKASGTGTYAADLSGMFLYVTMVEVDPLFKFNSTVIVTVMDRAQKSAAVKSGQLGSVDSVVAVSVRGDQMIATRIADDDVVNMGLDVAVEPAGQSGLLEGQALSPLKAVQHLANSRDRGRQRITSLNPLVGLNSNFGIVAMQVNSDIIGFHDGSFQYGSFLLIEPLYSRMPSFHIFTNNTNNSN